MCQKLCYNSFRTIKTPLKFVLAGIFIFLGLFFTNEAISAASIFEEDFENCTTGLQLPDAGCNWLGSTGETPPQNAWWVAETSPYSGLKSAFAPAYSATMYAETWKIGENIAAGVSSFWAKFSCLSTDTNRNPGFLFKLEEDTTIKFQIKIIPDTQLHCVANSDFKVYYATTTAVFTYVKNIVRSEYHFFLTEFEDNKFRVSIDNGPATDWISNTFSYLNTERLSRISEFANFPGTSDSLNIWVDRIGGLDCGRFQTYYTCQQGGCAWYYHPLFGNFCAEISPLECASGWDTCQHCGTIETCEAEDYCYWFENSCWYGTGVCGEGLALQFCENQGECEGAGGYWYSNFCWLSGPPTNLLDWEDYYAEHGDYATPSAWITGVASSTTGFFGTIGGFLSSFSESFNLQDAYSKGAAMGSAIPTARSYLGIINEFLGNLPFAEFFIFILGFMLAIGVFRITRNLIQTLKFW